MYGCQSAEQATTSACIMMRQQKGAAAEGFDACTNMQQQQRT